MQLSVRTRTHVPGSPTFSGAPVLYGKSVAVLPPHRHIYSVIFEDEVFMLDIVTYLNKYEYKYKILISLLEILSVADELCLVFPSLSQLEVHGPK